MYSTSIGQFAPISGPMTARPTLCRQRRRSGRRSDSFCGSPRGNRAPCTCRACVACEAVRVIQGLRRMRVLLLLRPLVRPRRRQMSQPDHLGCPGRGLAGVRADVSTVPRPVSRPWPRWCLGLWPGSVPAVSRTWPRCPGRGPARVPDCALGPKPRWRPCTRVCASRRGALLCKDQPGISCHHHFMSLGISCHHHFAPPPPHTQAHPRQVPGLRREPLHHRLRLRELPRGRTGSQSALQGHHRRIRGGCLVTVLGGGMVWPVSARWCSGTQPQ